MDKKNTELSEVQQKDLAEIKRRKTESEILKIDPKYKTDEIKVIDDGLELKQKMFKTFGTIDRDCAKGFIEQLGQVSPDLTSENGAAIINKLTPIMHGIGPRDELETMLALQAIAIHGLTMEMAKRAARDVSPQITDSNIARGVKLSRTFTAQMEALGKYRNRGKQKMTVEHVHVHKGGQAIVGEVNQGGKGE